VAGVVADTSIWIPHFRGEEIAALKRALQDGTVVVPPLVIAELIAGAQTAADRAAIGELLQDAPLHLTPLEHWIAVGELRRELGRRGLKVSTPDAHIAQCALDRDAVLLTRDGIFRSIARHIPLRLAVE
jgi:predicted nucleic acid-binding protein